MFQRNEIIQSMLSGHNRLGSKTTMKKKKEEIPKCLEMKQCTSKQNRSKPINQRRNYNRN